MVSVISGGKLRLKSLNLSENNSVTDSVVESISMIFQSASILEELFLDETAITIRGLKNLLSSIKSNRSIRIISVEKCGLDLKGRKGDIIVELLKENISLTSLEITKNFYDLEFIDKLHKELELN